MLPLAGVTVVSLEQAVAAPFASRHLADLGARVIKVERTDGGDFARGYDKTVLGQSSHFIWLNAGKESIALDLKTPAGRKILNQLLARADVFIQNLSPGAIKRLKLDAEHLTHSFTELIVAGIDGYGAGGPYSERKAYDLLVQAEAGVLAVTGTQEEPAKSGIPVADIAAGMYLYSGILAALLQRQHTGRGEVVNVSMFDALTEWMGYPLLYTKYGGTAPPRSGAAHAAIAPYGPFLSGEGGTIILAIQNQREWEALCKTVLQDAAVASDLRFVDNSARVQNRDQLEQLINNSFSQYSTSDLIKALDDAGIAYAKMNSVDEVIGHEQLKARTRWRSVVTPAGAVEILKPVLGEGENRAVPALGEHSAEILQELGYTEVEIDQFTESGAAYSAPT